MRLGEGPHPAAALTPVRGAPREAVAVSIAIMNWVWVNPGHSRVT